MPTVSIGGVVLNAAARVPGTGLRVIVTPVSLDSSDSKQLALQELSAVVDQVTGHWSCEVLPSTETGHGYRVRAWWMGPSPGVASWFNEEPLWVTGESTPEPPVPPGYADVGIAEDGVPYLLIDQGTHLIMQAGDGTPYVVPVEEI